VPFSHGKVLFTFVKNVVQIAFLAQWPLTVANISEKNFATEMKTGASPPLPNVLMLPTPLHIGHLLNRL
jgi:hypothetical protein